jgi:hypothetical protein
MHSGKLPDADNRLTFRPDLGENGGPNPEVMVGCRSGVLIFPQDIKDKEKEFFARQEAKK